VGALGCVTTLSLPLTVIVTAMPASGAPLASRTVTVTFEEPLPASKLDGVAATEERVALGSGGGGGGGGGAPFTMTVAVCAMVTPPAVAVIVLVSAVEDVNEPVATPDELVVALG
jgi:hypothetical protein